MKRKLKITVAVVLGTVLLAGIAFGAFVAAMYIEAATFDVKGTPFESKYYMDEEGLFLADIPRDEYITDGAEYVVEGERIFDIRSYGASPEADFKTNRRAINAAITEASEAGGGVVKVSGGVYTAANIELKSNVTLRIAADGELRNISYETDDRENTEHNAAADVNDATDNALIFAKNAENIVIEGPGRISGQGATYCEPAEDASVFYPLDEFDLKAYVLEHRKRIMPGKEHETERDYLIALNYCKNATIRNVELYEAGSWTVRTEGIDGLTVEKAVINNNVRVANTDGIDVMGGKNIVIRDCFISTGDDGICLKTDPENVAVEGVLVENCEVFSLANCFKIGTATYHDVSDVTVRNCYFFMPGIAGGYAGIAIEATDGGKVSDVTVSDIYMEHVTSPLLIWLGYRKDGSALENVTVSGITSVGCDLPSAVVGYKKGGETHNVKNVTLADFDVTYREAKEHTDIYLGNKVCAGKMNMGGYPEITRVSHAYFINHTLSGYYDLPVYGLYAAYAEGLTVRNFNVTPRSSNTRPLSNVAF